MSIWGQSSYSRIAPRDLVNIFRPKSWLFLRSRKLLWKMYCDMEQKRNNLGETSPGSILHKLRFSFILLLSPEFWGLLLRDVYATWQYLEMFANQHYNPWTPLFYFATVPISCCLTWALVIMQDWRILIRGKENWNNQSLSARTGVHVNKGSLRQVFLR